MNPNRCNENNGMWKGDNVGINAVHRWIERRLSKPEYCERCNKETEKLDLANISQKYLRRLDDWEYVCRSCHMKSDGRMDALKKNGTKRRLKECQICGRLTKGFKWCKTCAEEKRREWWRKYNRTDKRKQYVKEYNYEYRQKKQKEN